MKSTLLRMTAVAGIALGVTGSAAFLWSEMYPDKSDPKNFRYVLWKHHILSMDLDDAVIALGSDGDRRAMIIGKSEQQLRDRFGYLSPVGEATPQLRECYDAMLRDYAGYFRSKRNLFIRHSILLVTFKGNVAEDVTLMKVC